MNTTAAKTTARPSAIEQLRAAILPHYARGARRGAVTFSWVTILPALQTLPGYSREPDAIGIGDGGLVVLRLHSLNMTSVGLSLGQPVGPREYKITVSYWWERGADGCEVTQ